MASFLAGLPPCPAAHKPLQHLLKLAKEHESRDVVVAYWARFVAVQRGIRLDSKSPDAKRFLMAMMDVLEQLKKQHPDDESMRNDVIAQSHIEDYALRLFKWADDQDRAGVFNDKTVKAFYTSSLLFDVLSGIGDGELTDDNDKHQQYARWKAAYIHKCLKSGETPQAGPIEGEVEAPATSSAGFVDLTPNVDASSSGASAGAAFGGYSMPATQEDNVAEEVTTKTTTTSALTTDDFNEAQKYCKYATSALNYQDVPTALQYLEQAIQLLRSK